MSLPILYSFRRCPYAIRARLALRYASVQVELREIILRDKPAEMLAISPKGTVPVLQRGDGSVIDESLDIMRWALAQSDPDEWLAQDEEASALIAINDGPFKQLLDRYKYADRYPEKSSQAWREAAVEQHIARLDARLRDTRYLLGEKLSLADMAIMPFVRQFAQVDAGSFAGEGAMLPFPALSKWLDTLVGSALFASVMDKLPPWQPGDALRIF